MYYKLLLAAIFHSLFGTASWIHGSILNPIEHLVMQFCNDTLARYGFSTSSASVSFLWSVLNTSYPVGFLLSTFVIVICSERFGRKGTTMVINNTMVIMSSLLMWIGKEVDLFELMIIGRAISGICLQVSNFGFIYLIECSDVASSGLAVMIVRCGGIVWFVLGSAFGLPYLMGQPNMWHYTFLLPIFPASIHLLGAIWMPESPKHLYITKRKRSMSIKAIKFYQGEHKNIAKVIAEYEAERAANVSYEGVTIKIILSTNHLKWPFWICLVSEFSSRMGGFDIENFYSTAIIHSLGISLEKAAIFNVFILRFPSIIFLFIALILVQRLNSRPYLLGTLFGGLVSITLLFLAHVYNYFKPDGHLSGVFGVIALFLGITSWNFGAGILPKNLPGELCPQISRSLTTAYQVAVRGLTAIVITVAYPPLAMVIGAPLALLPIMICGYLSVVWLWKYLPETNNKSVDEVVRQWMKTLESETQTLLYSQSESDSESLGEFEAYNEGLNLKELELEVSQSDKDNLL